MELSYRPALPADLPDVFDLYMHPTSNPYLTFDPMSREEFTEVYHEMLQSKNTFVVTLENEIVGTYRLVEKTNRQSHIVYLGGFTVKSSRQGQGIGHDILEHIKAEARMKNFVRIELTVDTENQAAITLYRKVGFEIEGKLRYNYRLSSTGLLYDEYVMAVLLT